MTKKLTLIACALAVLAIGFVCSSETDKANHVHENRSLLSIESSLNAFEDITFEQYSDKETKALMGNTSSFSKQSDDQSDSIVNYTTREPNDKKASFPRLLTREDGDTGSGTVTDTSTNNDRHSPLTAFNQLIPDVVVAEQMMRYLQQVEAHKRKRYPHMVQPDNWHMAYLPREDHNILAKLFEHIGFDTIYPVREVALQLPAYEQKNAWYGQQWYEYIKRMRLHNRYNEKKRRNNPHLSGQDLQNEFFEGQVSDPVWSAEAEAVLWSYFFNEASQFLMTIYQAPSFTDSNFPIVDIRCKSTICRIEATLPVIYTAYAGRCNIMDKNQSTKRWPLRYSVQDPDSIRIYDSQPKMELHNYIQQPEIQAQMTGTVMSNTGLHALRTDVSNRYPFCEYFVFFKRLLHE